MLISYSGFQFIQEQWTNNVTSHRDPDSVVSSVVDQEMVLRVSVVVSQIQSERCVMRLMITRNIDLNIMMMRLIIYHHHQLNSSCYYWFDAQVKVSLLLGL